MQLSHHLKTQIHFLHSAFELYRLPFLFLIYLFLIFIYLLTLEREKGKNRGMRGGEREREGERETPVGCLPYVSDQVLNSQRSYVP